MNTLPDKQTEILALIEELKKWKTNRDKASARRTHGGELDSSPLEKAINYLWEYSTLLD